VAGEGDMIATLQGN